MIENCPNLMLALGKQEIEINNFIKTPALPVSKFKIIEDDYVSIEIDGIVYSLSRMHKKRLLLKYMHERALNNRNTPIDAGTILMHVYTDSKKAKKARIAYILKCKDFKEGVHPVANLIESNSYGKYRFSPEYL